MQIKGRSLGVLLSVAGILLISSDALLLRLAEGAGPFEATFFRSCLLALGWLALIAVTTGNPFPPFLRLSRVGLVASGVLAANIVTFVLAVQNTSVANTMILLGTVPAFAGVMGVYLLRETLSRSSATCVGLSFLGVLIIFGGGAGLGSAFGNVFAVLCAASYALYIVLLRLSGRDEIIETLCLGAVIAAVVALPFADPTTVSPSDLAVLGFQRALLLPLGFALYFSGTKYLPAADVALIALLEMVIGPLWAWAVLREHPGAAALVGGAVVVAAVIANAGIRIFGKSAAPAPGAPA